MSPKPALAPGPAVDSQRSRPVVVAVAMIALLAAVVFTATAALSRSADAQPPLPSLTNGQASWAGWTFLYDSPWSFDHTNPVPGDDQRFDGLALAQVAFDGLPILQQVSFPVMNVYYEDESFQPTINCGPFSDRLGGVWAQRPKWRTFTDPSGVNWFELGIEAEIGAYYIYQAYYFSETGLMDVHMFSGGLECNAYHQHFPFMRMDFDLGVNGAAHDRILRQTSAGLVAETVEFARSATDALNHEWYMADGESGDRVLISFDDGSYVPPNSSRPVGAIVPEQNYLRNNIYGLAWNPNEMDWGEFTFGSASRTLKPGWVNGQNIDRTDNVLWYTSYMPHDNNEPLSTWHSTGIRLTVLPATPTCGGQPVTVDLNRGQLPTPNNDVILGTPFNDTIGAQAGDDYVCAGAGDDVVWGQDGNDWIEGGDGNDKLRGSNGDDVVLGGPGVDDVDGGRGRDWVSGEAGNDARVRGGTGDDTVRGGEGDDLLVAGNGGEDQVFGGPGNDKVTGGPRPDLVSGDDGNDEVKGNGGADQLYGGPGADVLLGAKQPDVLNGGEGLDACNGGTTGLGAIEADQVIDCESVLFIP